MNLASPVVPQIAIPARQGFLIVTFAITIDDDIQALSGMCVKQVQGVHIVRNGSHFWLGRSSAEQAAGEDHRQQKTYSNRLLLRTSGAFWSLTILRF